MRKIYQAIPLLLTGSLILFLLPRCKKDHITRTYTMYTPIFTSKVNVLANINGDPSQPIVAAGKLYFRTNTFS